MTTGKIYGVNRQDIVLLLYASLPSWLAVFPCIWVISYLLLPSYFSFIDVNINATTEKRTGLRKRVQVTVLQRATGYQSNQCMVGQY